MNLSKLSIAALFLTASITTVYGQQDSLKTEKKIEGVTIKGNVKKSTESNIIAEQKRAIEVIERVGAVQLEKQGVGDVATAVTKATGTQKQEGSGMIFIRGLGDRYNATTLNGLFIPSDNPEFKNIDLSIFKTSMVEYISMEKVYMPKLLGDFGGANINIVSKEHTGKPYLKVGMNSSMNLQTFNRGDFKRQDGMDFFGFKATQLPTNPNPAREYAFKTSWDFKNAYNPFNSGINLEGGTNLNVGSGRLAVFGYAGFDNDYMYREGQENNVNANGEYLTRSDVQRYTYNANTTGLLNLIYRLSPNNRFGYSLNFINSSNQDIRVFDGEFRDNGANTLLKRGDNKITRTLINQLFGEHKFADSWELKWALGYNDMNSKRPDRMQTTVDNSDPNAIFIIGISPGNNQRYFDEMKDKNYLGYTNISKQFENAKITIGYDGQYKTRNFSAIQIMLRTRGIQYVNPNFMDSFFNPANNHLIEFSTFRGLGASGLSDEQLLRPLSYYTNQTIHTGFANIEYKFNDRFVAQLGGRFDYINQFIKWDTNIGQVTGDIDKNYYKFLPSLNLKYSLTDIQNLRFAAAKTYTLPQSKELAPFYYQDVTSATYGQPNLYPSDNYHADLKWEFFPKSGEVISLAAFGKYIMNPIARTNTSSASSNDLTYLNVADSGMLYGVEAEIRKDLYTFNSSKIYTFLNATYMNGSQKLSNEKAAREAKIAVQFDNATSEIQGAANFLANLNLGLNHKWQTNKSVDFVVSYAYVGKSLFSIGTNNIGNVYQKAINLLDANLKFNLDRVGISINAKNLLNPKFTLERINRSGKYIQETYNRGREIGIGLSYKL